ncbi:hypothetical protein BN946_scf184830.g16 [Trametes cinnabarina]|uniref:SANT domain-containing protein n=1 Tax=Pycnoporus cinnabarinus TaxID=5643 RepID=A0A060SFG1_PYCCI|nr:hypothetical protein BN946_scf184830.g16 [Trametes cinnabarina]
MSAHLLPIAFYPLTLRGIINSGSRHIRSRDSQLHPHPLQDTLTTTDTLQKSRHRQRQLFTGSIIRARLRQSGIDLRRSKRGPAHPRGRSQILFLLFGQNAGKQLRAKLLFPFVSAQRSASQNLQRETTESVQSIEHGHGSHTPHLNLQENDIGHILRLRQRPFGTEFHWAPEDDDLYADRPEGPSRDFPSPALSVGPASQDREDRRFHLRGSVERSVSPVSSRAAQHSSPGYMPSAPPVAKRESPELPHLEALPPKPYLSQPVRIPLGSERHPSLPPKPVSRSPSHSSTASSTHLPHAATQPHSRGGLPPKPQFQAQSRTAPVPSRVSSRAQTKSPVLQISSVPLASTALDSFASTPNEEKPSVQPPSISLQPRDTPVPPQQKQSEVGLSEGSSQVDNVQNHGTVVGGSSEESALTVALGRRSYLHRAPSFVPSTLAIDAKLKFPDTVSANKNAAEAVDSQKTQGSQVRQVARSENDNEAESDMEMSLPATPIRPSSPATLTALDAVSEVRGLQERDETGSDHGEQDRAASEGAEDAADASDMDMSPPASPTLAPTEAPSDAQPSNAPLSLEKKDEQVRPSLTIITSIASPQLTRGGTRSRAPPSSTASTPHPEGDESDMDMSSPASSAAPSPLLVAQDAPRMLAHGQPSSDSNVADEKRVVAAESAAASGADAPKPLTSKSSAPGRRDVAISPLIPHIALSTSSSTASTPRAPALRDGALDGGLASTSSSPRIRRTTASMERHQIDAGELSPPVSEETLREETEGVEKESDTTMRLDKETPVHPRKQPASSTVDHATSEPEKMTEIPLSEALRMVVRLRMHFPSQSQEERVEPIILSNRHIAEPEEPEAPAAEALVESVIEKEREQLSSGGYDGTKHSLRKRFAEHKAALAEKVERLRKEYLALHEKWLVHCSKLDEVARASALEEAAATAGRTTRRSAAMGDAVRTDLEMEQILASLGNEELTDANHLSAKNAATIPDMLSVTKGHFDIIYDDTNHRVEDAPSFYALETGIDDWTDEEKAIFIEKYAMYPKQFGLIASFLPNKTPAQCVTFYYLHKNTTIDFRKVVAQYQTVGKRSRRGRGRKQKGNALLADILKHDDEVSRDSTSGTSSGRRRRGPASATGPSTLSVPEPDATFSTGISTDQQRRGVGSRRSTTQNTPVGTPTPDPEPAPKRPRRRANPSARAAAAIGQDNGDDVDEDARPAKRSRKGRKSKAGDSETVSSTPAAEDTAAVASGETMFIDQTEMTARKKAGGSGASWSDEDKELFLKLLSQHGDDFKRIAASMPNKTTVQVTSFYKANLVEMELSKVAARAPKRSPTPSGSGSGRATPSGSAGSATLLKSSLADAASTQHVANSSAQPHASASAPEDSISGAGLQSQNGVVTDSASTLTTTFPTFTYSNLGPSHFAGGHPPPSAFAHLSLPHSGGNPHSPPMIMEFSDFAPQPWTNGPGQNGAPAPGLPAALATTEDLVRYLEHRTRLTAGQNADNDFL